VTNTYKDFQGFVTTVLKLLKSSLSSFKVVLTLKGQFLKKINDWILTNIHLNIIVYKKKLNF